MVIILMNRYEFRARCRYLLFAAKCGFSQLTIKIYTRYSKYLSTFGHSYSTSCRSESSNISLVV